MLNWIIAIDLLLVTNDNAAKVKAAEAAKREASAKAGQAKKAKDVADRRKQKCVCSFHWTVEV